MLRIAQRVLLSVLIAAAATGAIAQTYPTRPVTVISPFAAGGIVDFLARLVAANLGESMKGTFVVENRTGASGNIGLQAVASAPPDGHSLLLLTQSIAASNPSLMKDMPVDPAIALVPISLLITVPNVLVVHPDVPARNVKDLVAYLKSNKKLNFGSSGVGTTTHVGWLYFEEMAGVSAEAVAYKGDTPMYLDLLANRVQISMPTMSTSVSHIQGGKLRALAVTGLKRSPTMPDIPTVAESGYPGYEAITFFGLATTRGTPEAIVRRLNSEVNSMLARTDVKAKLFTLGAEPGAMSPSQFEQYIKVEREKWGKIIKSRGITLN